MYLGSSSVGTAPTTITIPMSDEPVTFTAKFPDGKEVVQSIVPDRTLPQIVFAKPTSGVATKHPPAVKSSTGKSSVTHHTPEPKAGRDETLNPFKE
jgi:hypothetical protein